MPEHYGTLEDAGAYIATLAGGEVWAGALEQNRTNALIRASRALDGQYGARYPGVKTGGRAQALGWPRTGAVDHCAGEEIDPDTVPVEIERATYTLALAELTEPGASTPTVTPGQQVQSESVSGAVSVSYFAPGQGSQSGIEGQRAVLFAVEDALRCVIRPKTVSLVGKAVRG